jgi:hypothetical protein
VDLYIDHVSVRPLSGSGLINLIPDGTFESGQGAWGGWSNDGISVVNTTAHSGLQSLKGTAMRTNAGLSRDIMAMVAPGMRYRATAWVSVGNLATGSGLVKFQTVQSCNSLGSDTYPWLTGATVSNGEWQEVTGTVDLTACASIEKLFLFVGADAGDLYVDDVTLTAL